uniref:GOLD domain-containing protein n=1 Tax=Romanomermis culicivorax TaxID=13658 RepID=A0A915JGV1_ROMCU
MAALATLNIAPPSSLMGRQGPPVLRQPMPATRGFSHGETATVRVPTHQDGARLYWEFATDYYDLGFGVYFEWSVPETDEIVVQISESDDEDEDDENDYDGGQSGQSESANDIEGRPQRKERKPVGPPVDEILPIYRRDCHEEVHAGSHPYPGVGVYLLKFDNTYSLWRSKYLYYRFLMSEFSKLKEAVTAYCQNL